MQVDLNKPTEPNRRRDGSGTLRAKCLSLRRRGGSVHTFLCSFLYQRDNRRQALNASFCPRCNITGLFVSINGVLLGWAAALAVSLAFHPDSCSSIRKETSSVMKPLISFFLILETHSNIIQGNKSHHECKNMYFFQNFSTTFHFLSEED